MSASIHRSVRRATLVVVLAGLTALMAHAGGRALRPTPPAKTTHNAVQLPARPLQAPPRIEVAFVLDTTGSMSGLIEGAKQKIWSIANRMATGSPRPQIRIALLGYRDRGDEYVTTRFDLTEDIDDVYAKLMSFRADGGGDTPESVNQALHEAVTELDWSQGDDVYKVVFLVGDAPPHADYDDVPAAKSAELAALRGIAINTIQCGNEASTAQIWRQLAALGGGEYAAIAQSGAMVAMATPMDDELATLNRELSRTAIAYGGESEQQELREKVARSLSAPPEVAAERLSYLGKLGGRLNAGRRDLVDAVNEGLVALDGLSREELPAEMKPMAPAEREAYVAQRLGERKRVQTRIDGVAAKRDAYVTSERERLAREGGSDGFDEQVFEAIRSQAAAAGIAYE